jgi:uncharacterized glyoxalase superfamily protein PhnB
LATWSLAAGIEEHDTTSSGRHEDTLRHIGGIIMAPTTATALQATTLSTSFTVDDIQKSITFFEGLGFAVEERWENEGTLLGATLRAGETQIGLSQDDWKKGRDRQKGIGVRLYIHTRQDIDQLAARAKTAGVRLDSEPHDTEWGSRVFGATDPSGFKVTISYDK